MNTKTWISTSAKTLADAGIATARLDALVLLCDALGRDKAWVLANPEHELSRSTEVELNTKIVQRAKHVPLAYIRGKAEFYGREFVISPHTLVPRPETETMIELLKQLNINNNKKYLIVDIGTGSGAIAITAKLEHPDYEVIATDIDEKCLQTARTNAQKLGADITLVHGNLLEPLTINQPSTILLCNLPYVPDNFQINRAATHEPRHALFGGIDGLDLYRELFAQIDRLPSHPSYVLTESLPPQHEVLAKIAQSGGYSLLKSEDFIQVFTDR